MKNDWTLEFNLDAERDLAKLSGEIRRRIIEKLDWLVNNFQNTTPIALTGEFGNFYKLRTGKWRIIYKINWENNKIIIHYIDARDKIYKKK